jgi:uracil-DNA glycosylase
VSAASRADGPGKAGGETDSAEPFVPARPTLAKLRAASKKCRGCRLWKFGTQTVFGEGPPNARIVLVGEQPGDQEDRTGHPFVGPSGRLLDAALEGAGIDRASAYVTNAVKHFKWEERPGTKRRIHKKPGSAEVIACHPWLEAELELLEPRVVVCLGATAAQSLLGKDFRVSTQRGKVMKPWGATPVVIATVHPSSVLRAPSAERAAAERDFFRDVKKVARYV